MKAGTQLKVRDRVRDRNRTEVRDRQRRVERPSQDMAKSIEKVANATVPKHIRELAKQTEEARLLKNQHSSTESKSKKALFEAMEVAGIRQGSFQATLLGRKFVIDLSGTEEDTETVTLDLKKLKKLVSEEVFMQCIVAQVGLTTAAAGKNVLDKIRVVKTVPSEGITYSITSSEVKDA